MPSSVLWAIVLVTTASTRPATPSTPSVETAASASRHYLDVFAGGDTWPTPDAGGHGFAYLGWRWQTESARVRATYNTDTLTLSVDELCWTRRACFGVVAKGQLVFAGLLTDYYEEGQRVPEFGFSASYLLAAVQGRFIIRPGWFVDLQSGARRWYFGRTDDTANFDLPPETWVFEQQATLTIWSFAPDESTAGPGAASWRLRGFGFGLQANFHRRLDIRRWGPRPESDQLILLPDRNDPDQNIFFVRQWAALGTVLSPGVRLQLTERAGWGFGEDDLTRARVGGLNPYVVPIAGVPWAAFLSGRYVAGQLTLHLDLGGDIEIGPQIDVAAIRDVRRRGDDTLSMVLGLGAFVDARWGAWQGELRVGFSPDVGGWQAEQPHLSAYAVIGRTFEL